jgi:hypothetical protein
VPTPEPTPTANPPVPHYAEENPYAPQTGDLGRQIAGVTITSVSLAERFDLTPPRVVVGILGSMPSVCSELRIAIEPPDENFRSFIEVYSLMDSNVQPATGCFSGLKPPSCWERTRAGGIRYG